jgi:hypothetical protein
MASSSPPVAVQPVASTASVPLARVRQTTNPAASYRFNYAHGPYEQVYQPQPIMPQTCVPGPFVQMPYPYYPQFQVSSA